MPEALPGFDTHTSMSMKLCLSCVCVMPEPYLSCICVMPKALPGFDTHTSMSMKLCLSCVCVMPEPYLSCICVMPKALPGFDTHIGMGMRHMGLVHHVLHPELKAPRHVPHKMLECPRPTCICKQALRMPSQTPLTIMVLYRCASRC